MQPIKRLPQAAWPALLGVLVAWILAGCNLEAGGDKTVIQIRIRSNRVAAQTRAVNTYFTPTAHPNGQNDGHLPSQTVEPTEEATATPVPTEPSRTARPSSVHETLAPFPTPTRIPMPLGRPERIVIPSVGIDTPVVPVMSNPSRIGTRWFEEWDTASYAAGYHEGSALLGQPGNTVISGHNNIEGAVFRYLYKVEPGDLVHIYAKGFRYDYVVVDRFLLREAGVSLEQRIQNATWILPTIDERITLVSCWPEDDNTYRVIVVAKPVRSTDQAQGQETTSRHPG